MVSAAPKRERPSPIAHSPGVTKRVRTCLRQEENGLQAEKVVGSPYKRLQHARFPDQVMTLPPVLKLLDTLLMSPEEAMIEAAGTGQIEWLGDLLEDFDCVVALDAITAADDNGHFDIV